MLGWLGSQFLQKTAPHFQSEASSVTGQAQNRHSTSFLFLKKDGYEPQFKSTADTELNGFHGYNN